MSISFSASNSPHIRTKENVATVMWLVVLALTPALAFSIYHFKMGAIVPIAVCIVTSVLVEGVILKIRGKDIKQVSDGSAVLTGLLLAFNLPPGSPWWLSVVGSVVAIGVAKQAFGGLGYNIFNPALIGRAFLLSAWPVEMTTWQVDGVTGATPLALFKEQGVSELITFFGSKPEMYKSLIIGNIGGCIGETSALLLTIGGLFLLYKKVITWHTPVAYFVALALFGWIFAGEGLFQGDPVFYLCAGGVFLGAWFMATDMVTTPLTRKGQLIFGFGCGFITFLIRKFGGFPEGVSYSILLMNALTPVIDRYVTGRKFGDTKTKAAV